MSAWWPNKHCSGSHLLPIYLLHRSQKFLLKRISHCITYFLSENPLNNFKCAWNKPWISFKSLQESSGSPVPSCFFCHYFPFHGTIFWSPWSCFSPQVGLLFTTVYLPLLLTYLERPSPYFHVVFVSQMVKNPPAMQETRVRSLGWEDPLEKRTTTHSSILAWRMPWTEEQCGLQSMGSQKVGYDWVTFTFSVYLGLKSNINFCGKHEYIFS